MEIDKEKLKIDISTIVIVVILIAVIIVGGINYILTKNKEKSEIQENMVNSVIDNTASNIESNYKTESNEINNNNIDTNN